MKIGVIGIKGRWSSEALADAIEQKTGYRLLVGMDDIEADSATGKIHFDDVCADDLDGLVIKKISPSYSHYVVDRLEILKHLKAKGMKIFSDPTMISLAVNRLSGTLALQRANIPMPETVITERADFALDAVKRFGRAVFKPLFTSKARGMQVIEAGDNALEAIEAYRQAHPIMYIQRFIDVPGKDLGIVFLGGEYVATYSRVSGNESWNTTTHSGGHYETYEPDDEIIALAHKAQAVFGLDFTSVDIALAPEGALVFEVSAFGGFRGLKETQNIDAATLYAEHIVKRIAR